MKISQDCRNDLIRRKRHAIIKSFQNNSFNYIFLQKGKSYMKVQFTQLRHACVLEPECYALGDVAFYYENNTMNGCHTEISSFKHMYNFSQVACGCCCVFLYRVYHNFSWPGMKAFIQRENMQQFGLLYGNFPCLDVQ